jgi:hypothetical protein
MVQRLPGRTPAGDFALERLSTAHAEETADAILSAVLVEQLRLGPLNTDSQIRKPLQLTRADRRLDASMPSGFVERTGSLRYASPTRTFSSGPDRQQCVDARHFDSVAPAENRAQRR